MHLMAQLGPAVVSIGPFALLLLAVPVVLFGELLTARVSWLRRCNIPPAIVGGLIVAGALLLCAEFRPGFITLDGNTASASWLWPVLPQWGLTAPRPTDVERPFLILFFTCIGLNASWRVAKQGGLPLMIYLGLAASIAVLQAVGGVATALTLGQSPFLGIMTSNVSLMGGFGTAAGFAPEFEKAGLAGAASIGIAAAAFGVITGGVIAGLVGGALIERKIHRRSNEPAPSLPPANTAASDQGLLSEMRELLRTGGSTLFHLIILILCMKLGAFLSLAIQRTGITFPVYMGAMMISALVRNAHDAAGLTILKTERVDGIGSVGLMWLLAVVMIDLQLSQLAHAAVPMLIILTIQVALLAALAYWLVFRLMGRDYEAAVMSAGMIGFGLGATSNALATMRVLARRFGPAPRAFLIVPIVGAFLIDFVNALLTTTALNFFK